jgi:hypothetical protein
LVIFHSSLWIFMCISYILLSLSQYMSVKPYTVFVLYFDLLSESVFHYRTPNLWQC